MARALYAPAPHALTAGDRSLGALPQNDIAAIDRFHASFSAYQPRPTAGAMYSDVDAQTAMEFLSRYPELCGEADRLASKSVKMTVDVAVDDFERETAERLHALQQCVAAPRPALALWPASHRRVRGVPWPRFQAFKAMLEDRESVIAALDAEAEQARTDVQALQGKAKVEMEQMWKCVAQSLRPRCCYCCCCQRSLPASAYACYARADPSRVCLPFGCVCGGLQVLGHGCPKAGVLPHAVRVLRHAPAGLDGQHGLPGGGCGQRRGRVKRGRCCTTQVGEGGGVTGLTAELVCVVASTC